MKIGTFFVKKQSFKTKTGEIIANLIFLKDRHDHLLHHKH